VISAADATAFALAALVIIVVPGPSVLFVVGRALSLGRGPAIASVLGNSLGVYCVAVLVAFGLGNVVQRSDTAFLIVKAVGAAYLVWLGVQAIRHRHALASALSSRPEMTSRWRAARQGFTVGIANPKALIMFGAVLPQFVNRHAGHVPVQMLILALIAFAISLVSDSLWAVIASQARAWFTGNPRRLAAIGGAGGLAMIGVGVSVAATGRRD
jgi:threonine/homoserine/homoserine lactone efflux protein